MVVKIIKVVIVGAGNLGREVLWTLSDCNKNSKKYDVLGFIDEDEQLHNKIKHKKRVLGGFEWFSNKPTQKVKCVIAIGDGKIRKKIVEKLERIGVEFITVIHPSVIMSDSVKVGKGTIIQAGSVLTVDVTIGNHCRIDTNCTIAHDAKISDYVDLSPGVNINGNNFIQTGTFIGSGTVTKEKISIGKWCIIGAGTVLISDVPDKSLFVGVPGKQKKKL
ncbi:MAG: acetyltransferase [Thaumarchaeota archaeon]|nr:acetyltransferase [Nitrososphaerota archaeon]